MLEQNCPQPGCGGTVEYESNAAAGDQAQCSNGHPLVVALCPWKPCRSGRVAILTDLIAGARITHARKGTTRTCQKVSEVVKMKPVPELSGVT